MMLKVQVGDDPATFKIFNSPLSEAETPLSVLQEFCEENFGVPRHRQQFHELGAGAAIIGDVIAPSGGIVAPETPLAELGVKSLDRIAVVECLESSGSPQTDPSPPPRAAAAARGSALSRDVRALPPDRTKYIPVVKLERRMVPSDNSCLFECIAKTIFGGATSATDMRQLCTSAVQSRPDLFTPAVLGRSSVEEYVEWLSRPTNWGGYIELSALALELECCIIALQVQNCRPEVYGPEFVDRKCVYLIYDGIHYDYLVGVTEHGEELLTFPSNHEEYLSRALAICQDMKARNQYTDLDEAVYCCRQCDTVLESTEKVQQHAQSTGHSDFVEVGNHPS